MEKICNSCPRKCVTDRNNTFGFCGASKKIEISKVMFHHWEEPVISGTDNMQGSGAIFFKHCNLKCVYCQNYEISHCEKGEKDIFENLQKNLKDPFNCVGIQTPNNLAELFEELEKQNALNINLVTPTHYAFQILQALKIYKSKIPVVWNTGGFEDEKVIESLNGFVDVFLTDFKYFSNELASKYSACPNYFEKCTKALLKMREICPKDEIEGGLMKKGIIIRHLVLPTHTEDSMKVLEWIKNNLGTDVMISLMSQYTPYGEAKNFPELSRRLKPLEYKRVKNFMFSLGFTNGFVQEMSSADQKFIPDFKEKI